MKTLSGGAPRRKFFQKPWTLKLEVGEVVTHERIQQAEEAAKQLQDRVKLLETEQLVLHDQVHRTSEKLRRANATAGSKRGRDRTKSMDDYSVSHLRRLKRQRTASCATSLSWMDGEGYTPIRLEVRNNITGDIESVTLDQGDSEAILGPDAASIRESDLDIISIMLYAKDKYDVSGNAYHEMARICKEMPRHYQLKKRISELNKLWSIRPTPNGICGVQQSLEDRLRARVSYLHKTAPADAPFRANKTLNVKLSGDGTNIGKRLHVVNFTFTLLEEGARAYASEGNHTLAIFKSQESYEKLGDALEDIRAEVKRLCSIVVDGQTYNITYYLGGDWKFLAITTGIDSACSKFACIWCKCPTEERWDYSKVWSITDTSLGARTTAENLKLSELPRSKKKYNVSHPPLFPTIPLINVVIDNLHMFLRVADRLIDLLIVELRRQDCIEKTKKFSSFDVTSYRHLDHFERFVTSLGIPSYHFWIGKQSKQLKWRTLTGPEKLKVFARINVQELLPSLPETETIRIQVLWTELLQLNKMFSKRPEEVDEKEISDFEKSSKEWVVKFIDVYQTTNVTPYIHAMSNHVGQFMRTHGAILPFTQQGLEKFNDVMTKHYFRSTSHQNEKALTQLIHKHNRLEYLHDHNAQLPKHHEVKCSNCKQTGHNKLSCSNPCKCCQYVPFCGHLVELSNGSRVPQCEQEN